MDKFELEYVKVSNSWHLVTLLWRIREQVIESRKVRLKNPFKCQSLAWWKGR